MSLKIRLIEPRDNPALERIVIDTLAEFGCGGEGFSCNDPELSDLFSVYQQPGSRFWVVENSETETVVGGGGFSRLKGTAPEEAVCELQKFYFAPQARGQGVGKKLVSLALDQAQRAGYRTVYLESVTAMQQALSLYEKFGFRYIDGPLGSTGHSGCSVFMRLQLPVPEQEKA